jgi:hypothetical protein
VSPPVRAIGRRGLDESQEQRDSRAYPAAAGNCSGPRRRMGKSELQPRRNLKEADDVTGHCLAGEAGR